MRAPDAASLEAFVGRFAGPGGFYRYSLSGDLAGPGERWGLGNAVFAVKTLAAVGALERLAPERREELAAFIESFRQADGLIYDPWVQRRSSLRNKLLCLRQGDFSNFFNGLVRRAESRQAAQALRLLGRKPDAPAAEGGALEALDWSRPWAAGSHASHLLFFLKLRGDVESGERAVRWLLERQREDGSWGGRTPVERASGAMKVVTGLRAWGRADVPRPERLVDLALSAQGGADACSWLNPIYLLRHASAGCPSYRKADVEAFAGRALRAMEPHYFREHGGFSFHPGRANTHYYGAKVSRGLPEPDIHGTMLLTWGLSLLQPLLASDWRLKEVEA